MVMKILRTTNVYKMCKGGTTEYNITDSLIAVNSAQWRIFKQ